ncbi:MAG: PDZ domain-containing protein, partial [Propionibacteriaceae bacterium]|nr:PDZ domain-containing protein [Propionibacteriaceae bacterium]
MPMGYFRYPDIHQDLVAFCAADDLWLAPAGGGRAWRLTADETPVKDLRFSPDGSRIAWTSTRDGHWEVMVLQLGAGEASRLTYWGSATTKVLGWASNDVVLVASAAGEDNVRHSFVKAVQLDGHVDRLPYGTTGGLAIHPDGPVAVCTPGSRVPAAWKRYRGGTAAKLWLSETGADEWQQVLREITAGLVNPLWLGDRLVFASDHEAQFPDRADGQANLYSVSRSGDDLVQHTHHTATEGYVRDPASDGERIVYHARGALYRLDDLTSAPQKIDITLASAVTGTRPRLLEPTENLEEVRPDHGGNGSVVAWRGKAFYLSHRDGPARALAADASVRTREPRVLGDRQSAVMISDAEGDDCLEVHSLDAQAPVRRLAMGTLGRILTMEASPAGDLVASVSHDGRISVTNVDTTQTRLVGISEDGEATDPAFSPDGRYLVWSQPIGSRQQLMLADLDTSSDSVSLTSGRFRDFSPSFTADGKYLALLSARTFDPSYDSHVFNLMFSSAVRPYLIPLSATTPAPFGPSAEGWRLSESKPGQKEGDGATDDDPPVTTDVVNLEGFEERILAFGVPAGNYRHLRAVRDGVTWIHEATPGGVLGASRAGVDGDEPADSLELFSFTRRKVETLLAKVDSYAATGDGRRVVAREGDSVVVIPADRTVKEDDPARVEVTLDRLRHELDPVAEWVQMFDENARIMRDHYWRADMNGVDWQARVDRYRPLVATLASHDDLVDLLWETVGELNTSHAYVQPAKPPGDESRKLGLLGADLVRDAEGNWRIDKILPGESSDPEARSPLRAAGVGARVSDLIVGVNGRKVNAQFGPVADLVGAADKPTEITLRSAGADRRVVVLPLENEEQLRYQAWVAGRTAYVRQASNARLGYLHIPDMVSSGWAQFHRHVDIATRAEGLIVDVRYNRGGHTSQLVVERLARKVVGWSTSRHHSVQNAYPEQSPRGPLVFVANEFAGSDGDIVNAAAQALGLGPVIGVRTWGGVVGIDGRFSLVDGTRITQPRYAFWLEGYGWDVENYGIVPDIEVAMTPADWHSHADIQLDRAISEPLDRLAVTPAA